MEESSAKVITFTLNEVVKILVAHAKNEGIEVPAYNRFEIQTNAKLGKLHCVLYPPHLETPNEPPTGNGAPTA